MKQRNISFRIIVPSLLMLFLTSCAYQFIDDDGRHRVVGLVSMSTFPSQTCKASAVEVTTLGVSAVNLPSHGGFAIGYTKNSSIIVSKSTDQSVQTSKEGVENE